jgi:hypothetical protein
MANPGDNEQGGGHGNPDWQWKHHRVQRLIAIGGLLGLLVLSLQWCEMRKSTDAATKAAKAAEDGVVFARENARLDQRAWVTIRVVRLLKYPTLNEKLPIEIILINTGKTPALSVGIATHCFTSLTSTGISKVDLTVNPLNSEVSRGVVGPNVDFSSMVGDPLLIDTKQQIDDLESGFITLYVVGFVEYSDISEKIHHTRFAVRISGKTRMDKTYFTACQIGNTAD